MLDADEQSATLALCIQPRDLQRRSPHARRYFGRPRGSLFDAIRADGWLEIEAHGRCGHEFSVHTEFEKSAQRTEHLRLRADAEGARAVEHVDIRSRQLVEHHEAARVGEPLQLAREDVVFPKTGGCEGRICRRVCPRGESDRTTCDPRPCDARRSVERESSDLPDAQPGRIAYAASHNLDERAKQYTYRCGVLT